MRYNYSKLGDFIRGHRRSGSTTAIMKAAKDHNAILIAHNEEYAKQIGGVSMSRADQLRGINGPIFFDNGLVQIMCEDIESLQGSFNEVSEQHNRLFNENKALRSEIKDINLDNFRLRNASENRYKAMRRLLDNYKLIAHMAPRDYLLEQIEKTM